jgi:membrane protein DedA with SNARE-associated domain
MIERMFLMQFIEKYGYLALFFGSMIEGEMVVLNISAMSFFGKFNFLKVLIITFIGTLFADQLLFFLGRNIGKKILNKLGSYKEKTLFVLQLLKEHEVPFVLSFRFIFGIRILSAFVAGMTTITNTKFYILNTIAAIIWTLTSCTLGYCIGAFSKLIGNNNHMIIISCNVIMTLLIIIISHFVSKKLLNKFKNS